MDFNFYIVDVFTKQSCEGNPLAVVVGKKFPSTKIMQKLASEMNFSETVFINSEFDSDQAYPIRIFTPSREIEFTGHPLIGAAWVIFKLFAKNKKKLLLNTMIGNILIERSSNNTSLIWFLAPKIELERKKYFLEDIPSLKNLKKDVELKLPIQIASAGTSALIIPIKGLNSLQTIKLDSNIFLDFDKLNLPKLIYFFCFETHKNDNDICARFFFDADGLREDIATGNGAAFLAKYLLVNSIFQYPNSSLTVEQGFNLKRPSKIFIKVNVKENEEEIFVGGNVVPTIENGKLVI